MQRHKVDIRALQNLATSVNISLLASELGVTRVTLYRYLDGVQCKRKEMADRINANIRRLQHQSRVCEVVAAGLNARANNRLSVKSSCKGPMTAVEVLRYPLGNIDQRYDASTNTLLVRKWVLHDILSQSSRIPSMPLARAELIQRQLITLRSNPPVNLATGISAPHKHTEAYLIDLTRIEWATLNRLCQVSAARHDPSETGVVYRRRYTVLNQPLTDMMNGCNHVSLPTNPADCQSGYSHGEPHLDSIPK